MTVRSHRAKVQPRFPDAPLGICKHCGQPCKPTRRQHSDCRRRQFEANAYVEAAKQREGEHQRCVDCLMVDGETRQVPGDHPGGWKWETVKVQRDHPIELIDNGPRDYTVPRCTRCHNEKTQAAKAAREARRRGRPVSGKKGGKGKKVAPRPRGLSPAMTVLGFGFVAAALWLFTHPVDVTTSGVDAGRFASDVLAPIAVLTFAMTAVWAWWRWTRARRVHRMLVLTDALGRATNTDPTKVRLRPRRWRKGFPMKGTGHYGAFFNDDRGGPGRAAVEKILASKVGPGLTVVFDTREHTYTWDDRAPATEVLPEPTVVLGEVVAPLAATQGRVAARLAATVKGSTVEWGDADDQGPLSFTLRYPETFNDDDPAERVKVAAQVNAKAPGRWRATWDTEGNVARFERRPPLSGMIPNPVSAADADPWVIPFGVNEDGAAVEWDRRVSPHCLIVGPTGAGKTVTLRSIITTGVTRGDTVFCCDPKRTELTGLRGWPGIRAVASSIEDIIALITMLADEMDARYDLIEAGDARETDLAPALIVVDELTEVVIRANRHWKATGGKGSEHPVIERLLSMVRLGRTGRMHVVIGVQRPDTKIITGEGRDNIRFRVSLGPLSQDGARMLFGRSDIGRDLPDDTKGRATVQIGNDAMEVQTYYTPNPRELKSDWEQGHLDRLAAAARGQASEAVPHINAATVAAYAAAMDDPDAPLPRPRRRQGQANAKPAPNLAQPAWEPVDVDDLAAGLAESRKQWVRVGDTEGTVLGVEESADADTVELELQPAEGEAFILFVDNDTKIERRVDDGH